MGPMANKEVRGEQHLTTDLLTNASDAVDVTCKQANGPMGGGASPGPFISSPGVPAEATIRRALRRLDPQALATAIGAWLGDRDRPQQRRQAIAVDGKTLRGASLRPHRPVCPTGADRERGLAVYCTPGPTDLCRRVGPTCGRWPDSDPAGTYAELWASKFRIGLRHGRAWWRQ
jgi:hypothetical protein